MEKQPVLHFLCGKAGAGKSTLAKKLGYQALSHIDFRRHLADASVRRSDENF